MRCDDVRKSVTEGAPLDEEVRGHLDACPACAEEFEALRALAASRPTAPPALRERVLASFPARRRASWSFLRQAAALLIVGLGLGFAFGYTVKDSRERVIIREVPTVVTAPPTEDYITNVSIAGQRVYGKFVEVTYDGQLHVQKMVVDPEVKNYEQYCPVARQLESLSQKLPERVVYRKKY